MLVPGADLFSPHLLSSVTSFRPYRAMSLYAVWGGGGTLQVKPSKFDHHTFRYSFTFSTQINDFKQFPTTANVIMATKPAPSLSAHSSKTTVRRNLFHHQLSRRPTSTSTSMSGSTLQEPLPDNSSDIVVKDRNGNYQVDIPLLPPLDEEQMQEEDEAAMEKESKVEIGGLDEDPG